MLTISQAVAKRVREDSFAMEAISLRVLNNRAYAKIIKKDIEKATFKPVTIGSIVVALTRLKDEISDSNFIPYVVINSFKVISALSEITYSTSMIEGKLTDLREKESSEEFFSITQGGNETTIICPTERKEKIQKGINTPPKVIINNLVAVSVSFSDKYMDTPNTIYSLVRALALRKINVIEIVSTYTELTFIVRSEELESTVHALNLYAQK